MKTQNVLTVYGENVTINLEKLFYMYFSLWIQFLKNHMYVNYDFLL